MIEVETVARAICQAKGVDADLCVNAINNDYPIPIWTLHKDQAEAAIAALREAMKANSENPRDWADELAGAATGGRYWTREEIAEQFRKVYAAGIAEGRVAEEEIARLREREAELMEALKPFADEGTVWGAMELPDNASLNGEALLLNLGDLRRARAAWEGK